MTKLLVETYDVTTMNFTHSELEINPDVDMRFYQNYLITDLWFDENTATYRPPAIIDLESGKILKEFWITDTNTIRNTVPATQYCLMRRDGFLDIPIGWNIIGEMAI